MNLSALSTHLMQKRFWIAAWFAPVLLLWAFGQWVLIPLVNKIHQENLAVMALRENIYQKSWLDSTEQKLQSEVNALQKFYTEKQAALAPNLSMQTLIDQVRNMAQLSGVTVLRTTPTLMQTQPLKSLKIKVDGLTTYTQLLDFLGKLPSQYPYLFLEDLIIRKSQNKLETQFSFYAFIPAGVSLP